MSLIRSKDAALYYEEHGSGEPLILLPGLLGTIESHWRRFIPELARQFHVIAIDLRGHGRTDNPSGMLRLHQLVHDLFAVYETLEIEAAHVCGYSLGGYIGLAFGAQHPGRVLSLFMHGTKFYWTEDAVASATREFDPETIIAKVPKWAAQLQRDHSPANGEEGWRHLLGSAAEFIQTLPSEGLTEHSVRLAVFPSCVSVGDSDEMIPAAEAAQLAGALPHARHLVLPGTRHPMQFVHKQLFLDSLASFFPAPGEAKSLPTSTG